MQKQVNAWAEKNKVEVTADFITGNGNKLLIDRRRRGAGEDRPRRLYVLQLGRAQPGRLARAVDDVMKRLTGKSGAVNATAPIWPRQKGHWVAVPTSSGTQTKPPCARISWFKKHGLDVQAMYPVKPEHNALQDAWTWDAFLKYAELAQKDGMTFALGMGGGTEHRRDRHARRAVQGVRRRADRRRRQHPARIRRGAPGAWNSAQKLVKFYPADAVSYDDASNNRALISGKTALIFNPPSAWAVAKRDAPQVAADCWTFPAPAGPKGRFLPTLSFFWGVYKFSSNKSAGEGPDRCT